MTVLMCCVQSPLAVYIMHPFWNAIVTFLPKWLAPNLMTFVGGMLLVVNMSLLAFYDPDMTAAVQVRPNPRGELASCRRSPRLHSQAAIARKSRPGCGSSAVRPSVLGSNVRADCAPVHFAAISQFVSHTLDGCDGKQARRTQSSTPLGELMVCCIGVCAHT
jgi:ethanolaminephosphotransferase